MGIRGAAHGHVTPDARGVFRVAYRNPLQEVPLDKVASPGGFEPLSPPWKGGVPGPWTKGHGFEASRYRVIYAGVE